MTMHCSLALQPLSPQAGQSGTKGMRGKSGPGPRTAPEATGGAAHRQRPMFNRHLRALGDGARRIAEPEAELLGVEHGHGAQGQVDAFHARSALGPATEDGLRDCAAAIFAPGLSPSAAITASTPTPAAR